MEAPTELMPTSPPPNAVAVAAAVGVGIDDGCVRRATAVVADQAANTLAAAADRSGGEAPEYGAIVLSR